MCRNKVIWVFVSGLLVSILIIASCNEASGRWRLVKRQEFRKPVQWIDSQEARNVNKRFGPGDYGRKLGGKFKGRFYHLHVPMSYDGSSAAAVVMVFHGGGSDPGAVAYESEMDATSDKHGFIVVYPAGSPTKRIFDSRLLIWNDGRHSADGSYSDVDDVGYVVAVLDDLAGLFRIDPKRVYACGFSNGAQFTYRLAKRLTNRLAAIATVAGQRPPKDEFDPPPSRPIAVMQFAGKQDKIGPYDGGETPKSAGLKAVAKPVKETVAAWVAFNGCAARPVEEKRIGKAVMERYGQCRNGTEVVFWTLEDGGHTWPGGNTVPAAKMLGMGDMGNVNQDIHASDLMWDFFKRHSL